MFVLSEEVLVNLPCHQGRPTRSSTCLHFRFDEELCCPACKKHCNALCKNPLKKRGVGKTTRCEKHWREENKLHRLESKRVLCRKAWIFIGALPEDLEPDGSPPSPTSTTERVAAKPPYSPSAMLSAFVSTVSSPVRAMFATRKSSPGSSNDESPTHRTKRRKHERQHSSHVTNQGDVIEKVPNNLNFRTANYMSQLENKQVKYDLLEKMAGGSDQCNWNDRARAHLAAGMAQLPCASFYGLEQFIPCVVMALFAAANIALVVDQVGKSCPSESNLSGMVAEGAANCLLWLSTQVASARAVFLGCDKGNRKGVDHFAKVISWCDFQKQRVVSYCLDIDGVGSSKSTDAAEGVKNSLEKLGGALRFFSGQTTDSGGGGVLENLMQCLVTVGVVNPFWCCFAPCTLHALQLSFSNGMKAVYGKGGLGKRNVLQLTHSCYDLQGCLDKKERHLFWEIATNNPPPNAMNAPVLTRWWCVNTAAKHLRENWADWAKFAERVRNSTTADSKMGKIARGVLSLMAEPKIYVDLLLVCAYSEAHFVEHFEWLQGHDNEAGDFGYRSRDMAVRSHFILTGA